MEENDWHSGSLLEMKEKGLHGHRIAGAHIVAEQKRYGTNTLVISIHY